MFYPNTTLQSANNNFRTRMKDFRKTIECLIVKNTEIQQATGEWVGGGDSDTGEGVKNLMQGYLKDVEEFRTKLIVSGGGGGGCPASKLAQEVPGTDLHGS
ncbi:hypothetical protein HPB51_014127 [Rhipicephalus microplus]|uniref:KIF21A/B first helical domain-containing protein n=1 Tax=Rhipicephalus microplus TaxID=6941 RepID=A0A9J6E1I9_RHIMP|nr:hypothetical protein HPB51_014127 [Rhipicephalus microplus]